MYSVVAAAATQTTPIATIITPDEGTPGALRKNRKNPACSANSNASQAVCASDSGRMRKNATSPATLTKYPDKTTKIAEAPRDRSISCSENTDQLPTAESAAAALNNTSQLRKLSLATIAETFADVAPAPPNRTGMIRVVFPSGLLTQSASVPFGSVLYTGSS
jgi:hypothetical protein